jgi:hypothetical protein
LSSLSAASSDRPFHHGNGDNDDDSSVPGSPRTDASSGTCSGGHFLFDVFLCHRPDDAADLCGLLQVRALALRASAAPRVYSFACVAS